MDKYSLNMYKLFFDEIDHNQAPFDWNAHAPLVFFLIEYFKPDLLVDLGVEKGSSFNAFCQAVKKLGLSTKCYGLGEQLNEELIKVHKDHYPAFSNLLTLPVDQALRYFSEGSINLLHLDRSSSYENAKSDFNAWLPKMAEDGTMLVHNIYCRDKNCGVWRLWEELRNSYPSLEFKHGQGMGVIFLQQNKRLKSELMSSLKEHGFNQKIFETLGSRLVRISYLEKSLAEKEAFLSDQTRVLADKEEKLSSQAERLQEFQKLQVFLEKELNQKEYQLYLQSKTVKELNQELDNYRQPEQKSRTGKATKTFNPLAIFSSLIKRISGNKSKDIIDTGITEASIDAAAEEENLEYIKWLEQNSLNSGDVISILKEASTFNYKPLISIIIPIYNIEENWLVKCFDSVRNQFYDNWEICAADDASTDPNVRKVLDRYQGLDQRIKVVYREENGHISAASNSALSLAKGEFIALLDQDDELSPDALYENVKLLNKHPEADFIYSDEDKIDEEGIRFKPFFKPDWSPDTLLSHNYTSHLSLYRTELVRSVGGFREGYEGSQDYDLVLRVTENTENIFHIPKILYHWRTLEGSAAADTSAKNYAYTAAKKALEDALSRRGKKARVEYIPNYPGQYRIIYELEYNPLISIIIPTKDKPEVLEKCLDSIYRKSSYQNYQVIIVDNGSVKEETFEIFEKWQAILGDKMKALHLPEPFNYSRLNNAAVEIADGDLILLLNDDTEVITAEWLEIMAGMALQKGVGAVGAKLIYHDNTIQHAGCILGIGGVAAHSHKFFHRDSPGYFGRLLVTANYAAVTGACLMVKKELYNKVGGFDQELAVAFNDIDFCIRIMQEGYNNLVVPYVELYHYEHKSRGQDDTPEKQKRFLRESMIMRYRWGELIKNDPYYNPNLTLHEEDFSLKIT